MRNHRDDILIGDDQWIEFISLEGRDDRLVEIDSYLVGLWPLIERLETECVAACCGFDAFDFTSEAILAALNGLDRASLLAACDQAQHDIAHVDSSIVVSHRMNNLADKQVMLQLLAHLHRCIASPTT